VKHNNMLHRLRDDGQGEIESVKAKLEEGNEAHACLEEDMKNRDADMRTLQASCTDLPFSCYQLQAVTAQSSPNAAKNHQLHCRHCPVSLQQVQSDVEAVCHSISFYCAFNNAYWLRLFMHADGEGAAEWRRGQGAGRRSRQAEQAPGPGHHRLDQQEGEPGS